MALYTTIISIIIIISVGINVDPLSVCIGADFPGAVGANAPSKNVWWVRHTQ